eukprot:Skav234808  [mRNA]  locus=scaffold69:659214:660368:- [translate_table: standard]
MLYDIYAKTVPGVFSVPQRLEMNRSKKACPSHPISGFRFPRCLRPSELSKPATQCHSYFARVLDAMSYTLILMDSQIVKEGYRLSPKLQRVQERLKKKLVHLGVKDVKDEKGWHPIGQKMNYTLLFLADRGHHLMVNWTPKAGCTGVVRAFMENQNLLDHAQHRWGWIHDYRLRQYRQEFGVVQLPEILDDDTFPYVRIKFVRNPYMRIVSSWLHIFGTKLVTSFSSHVEKYKLSNTNLTRLNSSDLSFRDFLNTVAWMMAWGRDIDAHVDVQTNPMEIAFASEGVPLFDATVQVESENLNSDMFKHLFGVPFPYQKYAPHAVDRHESAPDADWLSTPYSVAKETLPKDYMDIYRLPGAADVEEKVYSMFCTDFQLYGYDRLQL